MVIYLVQVITKSCYGYKVEVKIQLEQ